MKLNVTLLFYCLIAVRAFSQVDTTYIYNPNTPYGTLDIRLAKSSTRFYYLEENATFSFRENSPGTKTNTFFDMTAWDSSPYGEGHLREKNGSVDEFVMNYRLLKPNGYNASYAKGYPLIVLFHGAGERGNCWKNNCHHANSAYDPNVNDPAAPTAADSKLLNNDHQLLHGGKFLLDAAVKAGTMLPDDPALPIGAFSGFVLAPQNQNGWTGDDAQDAIRIVRLLMKRYNIDPDRIYVMGISNGGHGAFQALKRAPWLFSSAIMMSAIDDGFITNVNLQSTVSHIPLWIFQGGLDENPLPAETRNYIKKFRDAGSVIRYTEYAELGHTTWYTAFKEPDFLSWMLGHNKGSVHVYAGNPAICGPDGLQLKMPAGFLAYQWEKDGQVIGGQNANVYTATTPGKYRGRFSRISSAPAESQWNEWSPSVQVTTSPAPVAEIEQVGTVLLRDLNGGTDAHLVAKGDYAHYYWYRNGALLNLPGEQDDTVKHLIIKPGTCSTTSCTGGGTYTLRVGTFNNCVSAVSAGKTVFFNDLAPINLTAPGNFRVTAQTASTVGLAWTDVANENGYEIWRRRRTSENQFTPWEMSTLAAANATTYTDANLAPQTGYQYRIRAVSATGRSIYTPSAESQPLEATTGVDSQKPSVPNGLKLKRLGVERVRLSWNPATDDSRISVYKVAFEGGSLITQGPDTTIVIDKIAVNTTANFTVIAVDLAGNESGASTSLAFVNEFSGLFYEHSPGYWGRSLDSINYSMPEYVGTVQNFSLKPKTQDDYFYFRFDGFLYIEGAGTYEFRTSSDDASRLFLNGKEIVDNDGIHNLTTKASAPVALNEGAQRITVDFFDYIERDSLLVEYKGPDTNNEWQRISETALRSTLVTSNEPTVSADLVLSVFPNPSAGSVIHVQVESLKPGKIQLLFMDNLGRSIFSSESTPEILREGLTVDPGRKLMPGLYILKARQGDTVVQQKVIIQP